MIDSHFRLRRGIAEVGEPRDLGALPIEREAAKRGRTGEERRDRARRERAHEGAVAGSGACGHRIPEPLLVIVEGEGCYAFDSLLGTGGQITQHQRDTVLAARRNGRHNRGPSGQCTGTVGGGGGGVFQQVGEEPTVIPRETERANRRHARHGPIGEVHDAHAISRSGRTATGAGTLDVSARGIDRERDEAAVGTELRGLGGKLRCRVGGGL